VFSRSLLVFCFVALLSGGALSAGILYNQPFDGTGNALSSQNDSNGFGLFAEVYDNFTLAGNSSINEVLWTGEYYYPATQGPITSWDVMFYSDNAGQPDSLLYSFNINTTGGEAFLGNYSGFPAYTYDVSLTTPFPAAAGTTYWLSVVPTLGFPPQWGWSTGTGGDGISYQDFLGTRSELLYDMAFTLEGSGSSVPEPVSMTLVGGGLILLGFAARRRRA
jgi:hypothetical protein